jgi:gamma-glutamylputrescine oxidase
VNDGLGFGRSYYLATAAAATPAPVLAGETETDLVVVGGGCTGLSAALHAARQGLSVVVLEAGRVGWGASGRNGGQIIPGLRWGAHQLSARLGRDGARAVLALAFEARDLVVGLIAENAIDCDLRLTGHLAAAVKPAHLKALAEDAAERAALGLPEVELVDASGARRLVDTPYAGGALDPRGGHFHPLNYVLGLGRAAAAAGASIFEGSAALSVTETAGGVRVATAAGAVRARQALLAGDALLKGVAPAFEARLMPVASYIAVTEPLASIAQLLPSDAAVSDTRFVVNYYRRTADGRLLFGGGERYSPSPPADIAAFVRPHIERTFPTLAGVRLDYAWGGLVSITRSRLPHLARRGPIAVAQGYSGMGAILSTLAGKLAVEAFGGAGERFDILARLAPPAFPGGQALRAPLHTAGMLWYALRDRL